MILSFIPSKNSTISGAISSAPTAGDPNAIKSASIAFSSASSTFISFTLDPALSAPSPIYFAISSVFPVPV